MKLQSWGWTCLSFKLHSWQIFQKVVGLTCNISHCSLFKKLDKDGDKQLSSSELKELFNKIRLMSKSSVLNRERIIENFWKEFDHDGNEQISYQEFLDTITHWIQTVCAVDVPTRHSLVPGQPIKHLYEVTRSQNMHNWVCQSFPRLNYTKIILMFSGCHSCAGKRKNEECEKEIPWRGSTGTRWRTRWVCHSKVSQHILTDI